MRVKLIGMSEPELDELEPSDIIFTSLSQCYNEHFDVASCKEISDKKKTNITKKVLNSGHTSVSEHVTFTFLIENVSRSLTHQLVRNRIASFSQRSGRYTGLDENDWYVVPPTINTPKRIKIFSDIMEAEKTAYKELCDDGVPKEDARYLIGNGQYTNIVTSMNCRSLKNFFGQRLCTRAQWEIRNMAKQMAVICKEKLPIIFEECKFAYPKCVQDGFCREEKCCGLTTHISEFVRKTDG